MPDYTVITREAHAGKFWRRPGDYLFAAAETIVPLVTAEFDRVAMALPIAFIAQGDGYLPVALLGFPRGKNLLVTPQGRWIGNYIPAALRSYPFRLGGGKRTQRSLYIDAASGLITDNSADEPFFREDGTPAEAIGKFMEFLGHLEADRQRTASFCQLLQELQLIVPWEFALQDKSGRRKFGGLHKVDEKALAALPDQDVLRLHRVAALRLSYCQLLSLQHVALLEKLAAFHAGQAQQGLPADRQGELDLDLVAKDGKIDFDILR